MIVAQADWSDIFDGNFPQPEPLTRSIFREALAEVAEQAKQALPQSNGRVDKAIQIVLAGDIVPYEDGRFMVGSQSDTKHYIVLNNECDCKDFDNAPDKVCKHVIASWLWRKAYPLAKARVEAQLDSQQQEKPETSSDLPEAPASANCYIEIAGRKVQLTLRDRDEEQLLARMAKLLERFPADEQEHAEPPEGWCPIHQVQMKLRSNAKGSWWSHKLDNGTWCKGGRYPWKTSAPVRLIGLTSSVLGDCGHVVCSVGGFSGGGLVPTRTGTVKGLV